MAMRLRHKGRSVMHGDRYLLDTNAIVALLQGHKELLALTASAQWLGVSADVRKRKVVKLPDAIVVASAMLHRATLLTNDVQLLKLAVNTTNYSAQSF